MNKRLNLSDETIEQIYEMAWNSGLPQRLIGKKFGVSNSVVSVIKNHGIDKYRQHRDKTARMKESTRKLDKKRGLSCISCGVYFDNLQPTNHPRICWYCSQRTKKYKNAEVVNDQTDYRNFGNSPFSDYSHVMLTNRAIINSLARSKDF